MKPMSFDFKSRRSMVVARGGMVAASNPLSAQAGLNILRVGGNAADAAIAAAAVLNVTAPDSTGVGGDCFALFYDARSQEISALNGSGRAPAALKLKDLRARGWTRIRYPVSPVLGAEWSHPTTQAFLRRSPNTEDYLPNGSAPRVGQVIRLFGLADTLGAIAEGGPEAFYTGPIADAIVRTLQELGGVMTHEDLRHHRPPWPEPIKTDYRGVTVYECPLNGQGIAALLALDIAEGWELGDVSWHAPERLHLMVEAMRLAFADARRYVADPATDPAPVDALLSKDYAAQRRALVSPERAMSPPSYGLPLSGSDTVYLSVVDGDGNACSFINSLYMGFGTGIVAEGTGVFLQNRGANFSLDPEHPNALAPGKRPYHTIIPGMALKDGQLWASFGIMGGFMQPQGHFQVISAMVDDDLNPQEALDRPRFCLELDNEGMGVLALEDGIPNKTMARLAELGHTVRPVAGADRSLFGSGQIIRRDANTRVLFGGSDPRKDGLVAAF
jgi:gamma-glutamyltranspeptidase/glutathione hydrolase